MYLGTVIGGVSGIVNEDESFIDGKFKGGLIGGKLCGEDMLEKQFIIFVKRKLFSTTSTV